jgi:ribose 5-phosphate isomerase A
MTAADRALDAVKDGYLLGLGTGRAATDFVRGLGERVRRGLRVKCVATSQATATLAGELDIPLVSLEETDHLDLTVDGADEVDGKLDLIKGYGGALIREKIVAACSQRLIILVGPEKLVQQLGERGRLPLEVVRFGWSLARRRLIGLGLTPELRRADGEVLVTDNGNYILDCGIGPISSPRDLERELVSIPGVVGSGLFLGMADTVVIQSDDGVEERRRDGTRKRIEASKG